MPVMPDTRIPLSAGAGGGQSSSPFQTLGSLMKIKESQVDFERKRREGEIQQRLMEDDDAARDALTRYDRPEEAIDDLWKQGRSDAASRLTQHVYTARTEKAKEYEQQLKTNGSRLEQAAQLLQGVDDDRSYQTARKAVMELVQPIYGQAINDYLPTQFGDGAEVKRLIQAGTTRAQQIQESLAHTQGWLRAYDVGAISAKRLAELDPNLKQDANAAPWSKAGEDSRGAYAEVISRELSLAQNADQWDAVLKHAYKDGGPKDVLERYGPWNEDASERAALLGYTLPQRAAAESAGRHAAASEEQAEAATERARHLRDGDKKPLTEPQKMKVEDDLDTEDRKSDDWLFEQVNPYKMTNVDVYGMAGKPEREAYADRKIQTENKRRFRTQGKLKPIEEAARDAVAQGDIAGYDKLQKVYAGITKGFRKLEDRVKPPKPPKAVSDMTPAEKKETAEEIRKRLSGSEVSLTPAERARLQSLRDQLRGSR